MDRNSAFKILGISTQDPSEEEIKKAYKQSAMKHHPDKNGGSKESEEAFKKVSEAYEFLTKPQPSSNSFRGPDPFEAMMREMEQMFGFKVNTQGSKPRPRPSPPDIPYTTGDGVLQVGLEIPLIPILLRQRISTEITRNHYCRSCMTTADLWKPCQSCEQVGYIIRQRGPMLERTNCPFCVGRGWLRGKFCKDCDDKLAYREKHRVEFSLPSNYILGSHIHLDGVGHQNWKLPPGDVRVSINVTELPDLSGISKKEEIFLKKLFKS